MNLCPHCAVPSRAPSTLQWSAPSVEADSDLCCAVPCVATTSFVLGTSRPLVYNQCLRSALRVAFLMPLALGLPFRECCCVVCPFPQCLVPHGHRVSHTWTLSRAAAEVIGTYAGQHVVLQWAVPLVGSPASQFCLPRGSV